MRTITVRSTITQTPEVWTVPPHLVGKSCILCRFPFKDGDTHGELQLTDDGTTPTGEVICRVKAAVRDPKAVGPITSGDQG